MDICKLPIFNTDEHKLCYLTYSDEKSEWIVHTGDGPTITTLVLSPIDVYVQLEVPREESDESGTGMDFQIYALDTDGELCSASSKDEDMKFQNKRIRNANGKQICELSLNEEDGTWGITFYGKPYSTTLFLYYNGAYSQIEFPAEAPE